MFVWFDTRHHKNIFFFTSVRLSFANTSYFLSQLHWIISLRFIRKIHKYSPISCCQDCLYIHLQFLLSLLCVLQVVETNLVAFDCHWILINEVRQWEGLLEPVVNSPPVQLIVSISLEVFIALGSLMSASSTIFEEEKTSNIYKSLFFIVFPLSCPFLCPQHGDIGKIWCSAKK